MELESASGTCHFLQNHDRLGESVREDEEVERRSLVDLREILGQGRELGIGLLLIGGYGVATYTRGYRFTNDIDLIADEVALCRLRGLLKSLGKSIEATEVRCCGDESY